VTRRRAPGRGLAAGAVAAGLGAALVLAAAVAPAQMGGPRQGSDMPMMGPPPATTAPGPPAPEPSSAPPAPPVPAPSRSGPDPGMMSGPSAEPAPTGPHEHQGAAPPFYRERTFLVLAGVAVAIAGAALYRVLRSRSRRRGAAPRFVTEAVLVVDLVGSTHLATHYGDGLAMRARTALWDRSLGAASGRGLTHTENTGDGVFMTFTSVQDAVATARDLLRSLATEPPDLAPGPPLEVRAGISYGEMLVDGSGNRHGAVINKAFRLEGLRAESLAHLAESVAPGDVPTRDRILLDEEAAQEAAAVGTSSRLLGFGELKGFSGLHRIYEVVGG